MNLVSFCDFVHIFCHVCWQFTSKSRKLPPRLHWLHDCIDYTQVILKKTHPKKTAKNPHQT